MGDNDKGEVTDFDENDLRRRIQNIRKDIQNSDPDIRRIASIWSKSELGFLGLQKTLEADNQSAKWEIELSSKLYYALWILFIGGFVYSLNLPGIHQLSATSFGYSEIHLFRIIAIAGCALNFYVQRMAIRVALLRSEIVSCLDRRANLMSAVKVSAERLSSVELPRESDSLDADLTAVENYMSAVKEFSASHDEVWPMIQEADKRSLYLMELRNSKLKNLANMGDVLEGIAAAFLILALVATWPFVS